MREEEFLEPWSWLMVQPWASRYKNADDEAVQRGIFWKHLAPYQAGEWAQSVDIWIMRENRWPTLAEMLVMVKGRARPTEAPAEYKPGFQGPPVALSRILQAWRKNPERSYTETVIEVLTDYLRDHSDDVAARKFLDRAEADFKRALEQPKVPVKRSSVMTHVAQTMLAMEALEGDAET